MSRRSDLLMACIAGNRWQVASAPGAGVTLSANVSAPSNYDSIHHIETVRYSIANLNALSFTVTVSVRSSSPAGSVLASVSDYVLPSASSNVSIANFAFPAKRGMGISFTMDTVLSSVTASIAATGWTEDVSSTTNFDATYIRSLNPAAWYRFGVGISTSTGVSQWNDQSGNGNNLTQGTASAQPALQSDNSILFDGVDDFMSKSFTLNQPATICLLAKQVTWQNNDILCDGVAGNRMGITQSATSPNLRLYAGTATLESTVMPLDTYGVIVGVFNGVSSSIYINKNAGPGLSDAGAGNGSGLILGSSNTFGFANIQVKEVIVFSSALDSTTRGRVIKYLATVGGLNI